MIARAALRRRARPSCFCGSHEVLLTLKCPSCNKTQRYAPADAGLVILCAACGQRMVVPAYAQEPPVTQKPKRHAAWSFYAHPAAWIVLSGIVCFGLIIAGLMVAGRSSPPADPWEAQHRGEILALRDQARDQLAQRHVRDAYASYQKLDELVGKRTLADAELRQAVDRARTDRERVFDLILNELHESMQTAATQPSVIVIVPPPVRSAVTQPADPVKIAIASLPRPRPATTQAMVDVRPFRPALPDLVIRRPPRLADPNSVTDEEIGQAIQRGVDFLIPLFANGKLKFEANRGNAYFTGMDALCVYALLQSGQAIKDERLSWRGPLVRSMLSVLKEMPAESGPVTYARALRASALALVNRADDRDVLKKDVDWLIRSMNRGAYSYDDRMAKLSGRISAEYAVWDNSNSQYGLLGVWAGAEVAVEVNDIYWRKVENHWLECQTQTGEWAYGMGREKGYLAMTVAGIASLLVTHDYLHAPEVGKKDVRNPDKPETMGMPPYSPALQKALDWLEEGDNAIRVDQSHWGPGYSLYGIERVGLASGFKYLGKHDWYRRLARFVVDTQTRTGAWQRDRTREAGHINDMDVVETAYMLLFLSRGRHPVLMNKLRFGDGQDPGYWANRPRDAANLARFASRELERPLNWQVVSLTRPWHDWLDAPILYIASHKAPPMRDEDLDNLQKYAEGGGMIFAQADGGAIAFEPFASKLAARLGSGELQDLPTDHPIWSMVFKIEPKDRPTLKYVGNGSRVLLLYSPVDIALHWQQRAEKTQRAAFELGVNIFVYAAGKSDLRNRLASPYVDPPARKPAINLPLAKLRYGGNWNPEPAAHERMANHFYRDTGLGADWAAVDTADLKAKKTLVAHLTGTAAFTFSDEQKKALKAYVEDGGVLLVDACGGSAEFMQSARAIIAQVFPESRPGYLGGGHPLIGGTIEGMIDLTSAPRLRPFALQHAGASALRIEEYRAGHGVILFAPADLTTGLLGTQNWGIAGYEPAYCQGFFRNLIIWAATGARD